MNTALMALFGAAGEDKLYVEDVFSAWADTGTNGARTLDVGVKDFSTNGGMVWAKCRGAALGHCIVDTTRGARYFLQSNTNAEQTDDATSEFTGFTTTGFSLGAGGSYANPAQTMVYWTTRNAPKFFTHANVTKSSGSDATVDLSTLGTVGMVAVKSSNLPGGNNWFVWHRSLTAGKLLYLNKTDAEATLGHITVSGTTLTLEDGVIADGTYIVYAWAHDASADGIIQCGSFTTGGSGNGSISHGWIEGAQFAMLKCSSATGACEIFDTARTSEWSGSDARMLANLSNAEDSVARLSASSGALSLAGLSASATYMYAIIRSEAA